MTISITTTGETKRYSNVYAVSLVYDEYVINYYKGSRNATAKYGKEDIDTFKVTGCDY